LLRGRDVRVSTVAVAQGNLTVTISESPQVSQPNPLSRGRTVVTPRSSVGVSDGLFVNRAWVHVSPSISSARLRDCDSDARTTFMGIPPHMGKNRGYYARRKEKRKMELRWRSVGVPAIEKPNSSGLKA
jgi:hypothetical protein